MPQGAPIPRLTSRSSPANLASTLVLLAEAAQKHVDSPGRVQDVADRIAFRIRETEDLFTFCPCHGELPMGDGTIWSVICESAPLVAGTLIRRLFIDRLGKEFELELRHVDAVLFAVDAFPQNVALFEIISHCTRVRTAYSKRSGGLDHATEAVETLSKLLQSAPRSRVETDRGCVGTTSAVYGVRDSDAYFHEAEMVRAVLETLLSHECQAWPRAAVAGGGAASATLRRACVLVADISSQLYAHPMIQMRTFAFLSSAVPIAFGSDYADVNADFWTFVHMLCTSNLGSFVADVLSECSNNRMHDAPDLLAMRAAVFGHGRPEDRRRHGRSAMLGDVRLILCHVLLLLFHVTEFLHHSVGQPIRFTVQTTSLFRTWLLPLLRRAVDGAAASRWVQLREAFGVLAAAVEQAPLPVADRDWFHGAGVSFRTFAMEKFVPDKAAENRDEGLEEEEVQSTPRGSCSPQGDVGQRVKRRDGQKASKNSIFSTKPLMTARTAEIQLDPFSHPTSMSAAADPTAIAAMATVTTTEVPPKVRVPVPTCQSFHPVDTKQICWSSSALLEDSANTPMQTDLDKNTARPPLRVEKKKNDIWRH